MELGQAQLAGAAEIFQSAGAAKDQPDHISSSLRNLSLKGIFGEECWTRTYFEKRFQKVLPQRQFFTIFCLWNWNKADRHKSKAC